MNFIPVTPASASVLTSFLPAFGTGDANHSVGALVTRASEHDTHYAVLENRLLIRWRPTAQAPMMWMMPMGETLDAALWRALEAESRRLGEPLRFWGTVPVMKAVLRAAFPGRMLDVTTTEDWWDYLYEREAFVTLSGRALHGKRNFVKRFWAAHPAAEFMPLTRGNIPLCEAFLSDWYAAFGELTDGLLAEKAAIATAFQHWETLGMTGGAIVEAGKVLGFTYGAAVAPNMFAVHIEKAARSVTGAYPALSQCLAKTLPDSVTVLNREEDLGIPGLRKAKSEWAPCARNEKGWMTMQ